MCATDPLQAGHEVILLCDSDPGARQVLKGEFPGVPVIEDVASLVELPKDAELLAAGFPCIDVSRAGLRKGMDGESTGLVRHIFRLLRTAKEANRPVPWVLLENVDALLDRHGDAQPVIAHVVNQLMDVGYCSWAYRVISSAGFGLPNRRKRVFIVASWHGDARDVLLSQGMQKCPGACRSLFDGKPCYRCHMEGLAEAGDDEEMSYAVDLGNAISPPCEDIAPTFTTSNDRVLVLLPDGRRGMLRIEDAERLQGLREGWTKPCFPIAAPGIGAHRAAAKVKDADAQVHAGRRWDLLGNAVTVPVGRWLGERLAQPYVYKFQGITAAHRRMDALVNSSNGSGSGTASGPVGATGRGAAPNLWSFVTADHLQEAVLFPYLLKDGGPGAEDDSDKEGDDDDHAFLEGDPFEELLHRRPGLRAPAHLVQKQGKGRSKKGQAEGSGEGEGAGGEAAAEEEGGGGDGDGGGAGPSGEPPLGEVPIANGSASPGPAAGVVQKDGPEAAAREVAEAIAEAGGNGDDAEQCKDMYQAEMLERVQRRQVGFNSGRVQQSWDKASWPRCAWWVRGLGAFAAPGTSDCPVPAPYQPLGQFLGDVGRAPTEEETLSYIHRLKERGWELSSSVLSRLQGGAGQGGEGAEITRLPGLLDDKDLVGDIVWARDPASGILWPGEVLDPLNMPKMRDLPEGAVDALTPEQRRASVPCPDGSYDPAKESAKNRRVVVMFFPIRSGKWCWHDPGEVMGWAWSPAPERGAAAALRDSKFKFKDQLLWAIQDARGSLALKEGRNSQEAERAKRTRAAVAAAGVNFKQRCGRCRTCMTSFAGTRRYDCLTQRMKAAALSGHGGAQVAVRGMDAVGARVAVWWAGDQTFYEGVVCWFDAVSTEHTVAYDDGEVGMHKLWQHDERIRVLNEPRQWIKQAADARARFRKAHSRLQERRSLQKDAAVAAVAQVRAQLKNDYERQRQVKMLENRKKFEELFGQGEEDAGDAEPGAAAEGGAPPTAPVQSTALPQPAPLPTTLPVPMEVAAEAEALPHSGAVALSPQGDVGVAAAAAGEAQGPTEQLCEYCHKSAQDVVCDLLVSCANCTVSAAHTTCIPERAWSRDGGWRCRGCKSGKKVVVPVAVTGEKRGAAAMPKRRGRPPKKKAVEVEFA